MGQAELPQEDDLSELEESGDEVAESDAEDILDVVEAALVRRERGSGEVAGVYVGSLMGWVRACVG